MPEDKQTVGMHDSENIPHLGPCCLSTMGLYDVIKLRTLHFIYQQPSVIMSVIHPSWFRVIIALCEAIYQTFTLFRFAFYKLRNKKWDEERIRKRELNSSFNRFKKESLIELISCNLQRWARWYPRCFSNQQKNYTKKRPFYKPYYHLQALCDTSFTLLWELPNTLAQAIQEKTFPYV